ncbi:early nodulin-like protein 4 [Solanum lycopersicum]|nr:early nodulin-like protein 2 [Solanum lycopersicum]
MDSLSFVGFFFAFFLSFMCLSQGYTFYAGGKEGWVLNPSESYDHWARRNRFQVNDTIVFKYKKGYDSVYMVHDNDDYLKCNKTSPIHHLKDGHSKVIFTRNGPFYFIGGKDDNCEKGQKLLVVVMSPNHHKSSSPASSPVTIPTPPPESVSPAPAPAASAAIAVDVSPSSVLFGVFISLIAAAVFL